MTLDTQMLARVRGEAPSSFASDNDAEAAINRRGDILVAQSLPPLAEIVRMGGSYQGRATTGVVAASAIPTTTSGLSIVNNEPATGKCYVIDSFGSAEHVADATQQNVTAIYAMLNKQGDALATSANSETANIRSLSGRASGTSLATLLRSATVIDNTWFPHNPAGAQLLTGLGSLQWKINEVQVNGLYMVRPGGSFSIVAIKALAAAALQHFYFMRWHEVKQDYVA